MASDSKVWHPYTPGIGGKEIRIDRGEGAYLITKEGRRIFDGISSWWVNLHGHGHPVIAQAIARQAEKLEQVVFAGFTHEPAEDLAAGVLKFLPPGFSRVFYTDNGSTAVEVAIKMALQYFHLCGEKRSKILALENSYHGDTFGAMAVGARGPFSAAFQDWLFDVEFILPRYTNPKGSEEGLEKAIRLLETGTVAAIIAEPLVQGAGGMLMYDAGWLDELFATARKYGTKIIADEVFTGFYRTGTPFASSRLSVLPDLICLSKGLTGGFLPLGITACREEISKPFYQADYGHTLYHGHSFTANPLACAASLASLGLLQKPETTLQINRLCGLQKAFCQKVEESFPHLNPRQLGTIFALTLSPQDGLDYTHPNRSLIYQYFLDKDLLVRPIGNVLYLVPPYCASESDMDRLHSEIITFLEKYA
jgi:adenosylmethionine-8-amino-7-oxononanoate aminotransferase